MKITHIEFTKTFPIGMTWEKVMMAADIDDMSDPKESLAILKREVEEFHRISNPQLYPNGKEAVVDEWEDKMFQPIPRGNVFGYDNPPKPIVINRLYDDIRDKIKDCKTKEELIAYKNGELKNNIPGDVMSDFVNRLQELKVHG